MRNFQRLLFISSAIILTTSVFPYCAAQDSESVDFVGECTRLATSNSHTCFAKSDGSVWCWGYDYELTPVQIQDLSGVKSISNGASFSCALKTDGTVWCWGRNRSGQLGNGTKSETGDLGQVMNLSGVESISLGYEHACALKDDGSIWCWGRNIHGMLGTGDDSGPEVCDIGIETCSTVPVKSINLEGIVEISSGMLHTCAVRNDDTVWCWGHNEGGQLGNDNLTSSQPTPVRVEGLSQTAFISAGGHTCSVKSDGTAWCWGHNSMGELGDGTEINRYEPTKVTVAAQIASLSAGREHTCAVRNDGTVRCFGCNYLGQLGDGTTSQSRPEGTMVSDLLDVDCVSCGQDYTCAIKKDGSIWCWGANGGLLGDGTINNQLTPVKVVGL